VSEIVTSPLEAEQSASFLFLSQISLNLILNSDLSKKKIRIAPMEDSGSS